jgi:hypothetical protein
VQNVKPSTLVLVFVALFGGGGCMDESPVAIEPSLLGGQGGATAPSTGEGGKPANESDALPGVGGRLSGAGGNGLPAGDDIDPSETAGHSWCRRRHDPVKGIDIIWARVWPVSPDEAWLVGNTGDYVSVPDVPDASGTVHTGVLAHWDGKTICTVGMKGIFGSRGSTDTRTVSQLSAIWASGPNDVWVGGGNAAMARWDGHDWKVVDAVENEDLTITKLVGSGPNNVFALAASYSNQMIFKWDGAIWRPFPFIPKGAYVQGLAGIWLDDTGRLWWYAEKPGITLRNDCDVYVVSPTGVTCSLSLDKYQIYEIVDIDGSGKDPWILLTLSNRTTNRDDAFAVEHRETGWAYRKLEDFEPSSMRIFSAKDAWLSGTRSTRRWDGTEWSEVRQKPDLLAPRESWIMGVFGQSSADVWAVVGTGTFVDKVGGRGLIRRVGNTWQKVAP